MYRDNRLSPEKSLIDSAQRVSGCGPEGLPARSLRDELGHVRELLCAAVCNAESIDAKCFGRKLTEETAPTEPLDLSVVEIVGSIARLAEALAKQTAYTDSRL